MKTKKIIRTFPKTENHHVCNLYHHIAIFTGAMNELPDSAAAKKIKPRSAPVTLLDMVF
ncbi:MAG: hypothetical protein H3C48_18235 [Chitinophagaceae bacterium]|nr:hypothetical protein [Chitinophagaceae bacterium]